MKSKLITSVVCATLVLSPLAAMAAPAQQGNLAPGPAAGVQQAQWLEGSTATYAVVGVLAVALIVAAASGGGGGGNHGATNSTSGTFP